MAYQTIKINYFVTHIYIYIHTKVMGEALEVLNFSSCV